MSSDDDALRDWLRTVQSTDLGERNIISPSRTGNSPGDIIKKAGGANVLDTEPARYYKLLAELSRGSEPRE